MGVAKVCFIPHEANNHWPLALRHKPLAYVSGFIVLTKILAIAAFVLTPTTAHLSTITDARMVQLTNEARQKNGLPPLTVNEKLTQAALLKGQDMLQHQYFAHISPSGVTPWFWMQKTQYQYEVAGENLAIDFTDADKVVQAWLNSPSHRANLLNPAYKETGLAVISGKFQGGTSIIVVHMFGTQQVVAPAPAQEPQVKGTNTAPAAAKPAVAVQPAPATKPQTTPAPVTPTIAPTPLPTPVPQPAPASYTFVINPTFSDAQVALPSQNTWQVFPVHSPFTLHSQPIRLAPEFSIADHSANKQFSSSVLSTSTLIVAFVLVSIAFLLVLAIAIRAHVQHPALIAHASFVIILAIFVLST